MPRPPVPDRKPASGTLWCPWGSIREMIAGKEEPTMKPVRAGAVALAVVAILSGLMLIPAPVGIARPDDKLPLRHMENLGRGVVAIHQGDGKVFVGWRLLGTDPDDVAFNLYRSTGEAEPVRLHQAP